MKAQDNYRENEMKLPTRLNRSPQGSRPRISDDDGISNQAMNALIVVFILLTLGLAFTVSAQQKEEVKYRILLRQSMLDVDRQEYTKAIPKLLEVFAHANDNANVSQLLGVCYLYGTDMLEKAALYLSHAAAHISDTFEEWDLDEANAPVHTIYLLGKAYQEMAEFSKAAEFYGQYVAHLETTRPGIENSRMYMMIKRAAGDCELAAEGQKELDPSAENIALDQ